MKKSININGITTTSAYTDGDCVEKVNLRFKNGANHPVPPRKTERELSQAYDIIFIHKNSNYENWIGVIIGESESVIYYYVDTEPVELKVITSVINSVQQIGNTLSFITQDNIYYALYSENKYTFLGELPELPIIKIGSDDAHLYTGTKSYSWDTDYYYPDGDEIANNTKSVVNDLIEEMKEEHKLVLFDAHFIRYAFRLYDGSVVKHSPPVLLLPGIAPVTHEGDINGITPSYTFGGILAAKYGTFNGASYDNFVRHILNITVTAYRILLSYDLSSLNRFSDIIKSVDIYLSPSLNLSNIENVRTDVKHQNGLYYATPYPLIADGDTRVKTEVLQSAINNIKEESLFYKIRSLSIGSSGENIQLPDGSVDLITSLNSLIYQEEMPIDSFTHHTFGGAGSLVYNNRLHVSNIKTTFFNGFSADYFYWHGHRYNDVSEDEALITNIDYIVVELTIDNKKMYVTRDSEADPVGSFLSAYFSYPDSRATRFFIFYSHPLLGRCLFSEELTPHKSLNIAYYLNSPALWFYDKLPGAIRPITEVRRAFTIPDFELYEKVVFFEFNKIKVSELNNPFYFPAFNTYSVSNGEVLNMSANVMNVSDRNFGTYPIFVATTQGFFMLAVGSGEIVYSNVVPSSSLIVPVLKALCPTPYGIAFVSQRGIFIINGHETICITLGVEQRPIDFVFDEKSLQPVPFLQYIKGLDHLVYNQHENELIIINNDYAFNFVYRFETKEIYQSTERIDFEVENSYPNLLVADGRRIKNYSQTTDITDTEVSLCTRPLLFGIDEVKKMQRAIVRGRFYHVQSDLPSNEAYLALYGSNDGVHYVLLRGYTMIAQGNNYKDFDLGLMARATFRNCIIKFTARVSEPTEIFMTDFEVEPRYGNDKLR